MSSVLHFDIVKYRFPYFVEDAIQIWLIDWLIDWLIGSLIDWLTDWLTWLTDWPTDGLIDLLVKSERYPITCN